MKKFFEEFKTFITKGNVMDMAVGVIIGGAFGAITTALVGKVITPLLAWMFNSPSPDALNITLRAAELDAAGEVTKEAIVLGLGDFIGAIAAAEAEPEEPKPTTEELLGAILEEIKAKKE